VSTSAGGGLVLALGSAAALNWGFLAQHGAAAALPPLTVRRPLRSLGLLFSNLRWLAGFVAGLVGWALYVVALTLAPLSLVQAVSAGGIGLLALLVERTTGVTLSPREWAGVGAAVAGLVLLGGSLAGRAASGHHGSSAEVAIWLAASLVAAGVAPSRLAGGVGFGVAGGVLYAAGDVATKAAVGGGVVVAFVAAVLACHGLAFVALQLGFQRGGALATAGVSTLLTNALPIAAGMALFHESLPRGALGALRLLAFASVVAGAALLARPELETLSDLAEEPERARPPRAHQHGEEKPARERQHPRREAVHPHDQNLRRERAVDGDAEERVHRHAGVRGLEAELEDTVVGNRDRQREGQPARPAVDDVDEPRPRPGKLAEDPRRREELRHR
jgi:drug/metabolite transporter (DMT)-like permease